MRWPALARRRVVWCPTGWGALLGAGVVLGCAALFGVRIHGFLAPDAPLGGVGAPAATTLVVEGWMEGTDYAQAVDAVRRGHYARVITTGGVIEPWEDVGGFHSTAERAARYLRGHGVDHLPVVAVPTPSTPTERTYDSALAVRAWAAGAGVALDRVDVVSPGVHARRSRWLYELALGRGSQVGVVAATPHTYDPDHWWRSSEGSKRVVMESIAWVWTACCFWPPAAPA